MVHPKWGEKDPAREHRAKAERAAHPFGRMFGDPDFGMVDGVQRKGDLRFTLFGLCPIAPFLGWNAGLNRLRDQRRLDGTSHIASGIDLVCRRVVTRSALAVAALVDHRSCGRIHRDPRLAAKGDGRRDDLLAIRSCPRRDNFFCDVLLSRQRGGFAQFDASRDGGAYTSNLYQAGEAGCSGGRVKQRCHPHSGDICEYFARGGTDRGRVTCGPSRAFRTNDFPAALENRNQFCAGRDRGSAAGALWGGTGKPSGAIDLTLAKAPRTPAD